MYNLFRGTVYTLTRGVPTILSKISVLLFSERGGVIEGVVKAGLLWCSSTEDWSSTGVKREGVREE